MADTEGLGHKSIMREAVAAGPAAAAYPNRRFLKVFRRIMTSRRCRTLPNLWQAASNLVSPVKSPRRTAPFRTFISRPCRKICQIST